MPLRLVLVAALALSALLLANAPAAAVAYPSLFGTQEIHSSKLKNFPKWRGVVERFTGEQQSCTPGECNKPAWSGFVESIRGLDRMSQLAAVHKHMNEKRYIVDPVNWGMPDYWATPFQFLRKEGDCEDYAIAKFMALRSLGFTNEEMRIVVLQDLNLRLAHAVLVVYVGGQPLMLDNQIRQVIPANSVHHYQPFYSVNEEGWWLHRR